MIAILERDMRLRSLVRNPGLHAVAAAICSCTIGAQVARYNGRNDHREIRYGLLTEVRRTGLLGKHELAGRIYSFISAFNHNGARRRSLGLRSRSIRNEEMEAFRTLLGELPSGLPVSALLCALAACRKGSASTEKVEPEMDRAIPA